MPAGASEDFLFCALEIDSLFIIHGVCGVGIYYVGQKP